MVAQTQIQIKMMIHTIKTEDLVGSQSITLASSSNANGNHKSLSLEAFIAMDNLHLYYKVIHKHKDILTPRYSGTDLNIAVAEYNDIQC
jgi:hypothetical protein